MQEEEEESRWTAVGIMQDLHKWIDSSVGYP